MAAVKSLAPPLSIRLLEQPAVASQKDHDELLALLPASYRTESGDLAAACQHVMACVEEELDLQRLTSIHGWLWVVKSLSLNGWTCILSGRPAGCSSSRSPASSWNRPSGSDTSAVGENAGVLLTRAATQTGCKRPGLRRRGLGFLCFYAALLSHESDFLIVQDKHLLPSEVTWYGWRIFVEQLDREHIHPHIDRRFVHGELRLGRLNKIYAVTRTPMRGYLARWDRSG
ncbi:hypothetical protein ISF_09624 [Cordyceps fumosorosea ARSEF 2679]|uniref:Uncharacterized protein n=1 Tax=Cordyceps fumosorosea (strain ARSEF 2679) TaxID=1081104 RepID=A0A167F3D8_CORFA|nr:hypothetical protein ISF_09624 [Cordyceps fumosorosea ARSEF 2679]OAA44737.1 hypothetical protein ISF_09624 [Cordyceps fumosorosea ARSEF 2679]